MTNRSMPLVCAVLFVAAWCGGARAQEVDYAQEAYQKLDSFEAHKLRSADKLFEKKDFKQAAAAYESFVKEFEQSKALAYALIRKGRSLQQSNNRFAALKEYVEVTDYFINTDPAYAAAAMYYSGLCHWDNGDRDKAMGFWGKMAQDKQFSRHFLAAGALNRLADWYAGRKEADRALQTYHQVAVTFRQSNEQEAREAMAKAIGMYTRKPDEAGLRKLFTDTGGFEHHPRKLEGEIETDRKYWSEVCEAVKKHGAFEKDQTELMNRYYRYWAQTLEGKFAAWDDYQIDRIAFIRAYENDTAKWIERLDEQFEKQNKQDDYARIVKWIILYVGHDAKVDAYYQKLDFAKTKNEDIFDLMKAFYNVKGQEARGQNVLQKMRLEQLSDDFKHQQLSGFLWHKGDDDAMVRVCQSFKDANKGKARLLDYYYHRQNTEKGLPLANELAAEADYAGWALYRKGELLKQAGKHDEAIAAYRQSDQQPGSLFRIAECYQAKGQHQQAVSQLTEIENFFKEQASEALWRIAQVHKSAGNEKQYVASLRGLMSKYPKSGQSTYAHDILEKMGLKIGGGVHANE